MMLDINSSKLNTPKRSILGITSLILIFIVTCFASCNIKTLNEKTKKAVDSLRIEPPIIIPAQQDVHVAFSGGGWRAHTGHSAWTMSLLQDGNLKLKDVFKNVKTISSNSGGSWFSSMLMYSPEFVANIQDTGAIGKWSQSGWLGQQQHWFDEASCHDVHGDTFFLCVARKYTNKHENYWDSIVTDLVYKDYPIHARLKDPRQEWAVGKNWLLAASLLTNQVVLNENDASTKHYYQACIAPSKAITNGHSASTCSLGAIPDVSPVTFSSIPIGSPYAAPPFFAEAGQSNSINLAYSGNNYIDPDTGDTSVNNVLVQYNVPVMMAAAASSAAAGFGASASVSSHWQEAYELAAGAISFKLENSEVNTVNPKGLTVKELTNQRVVRIADGGPVDNSGVTQLVSFLQQNKKADGFNIVAFDNVQEGFPSGLRKAKAGIDIANLFGEGICAGNRFCSTFNCSGTCVTTPSIQIFEKDTFHTTPITWYDTTTSADYTQMVIYTKYTVRTIDNTVYGIKKGSVGTLHAFSCVWENAGTEPRNETMDGDFIAYGNMLRYMNVFLRTNGGIGHKYLEQAMGL